VITTQGGTLLDLYAGTGTIGMILASAFHRVISVEIVASASQDAQKNAQKNGITNLECVCAPVERWAHEYVKQ
jgi:23S rRNA (uracil1939-C5)-methyltransferase